MEDYELEAILDGLEEKNKTSWEQTRLLAFIIAQSNSSKKLKPSDIISFSWDKDTIKESADWDAIRQMREQIKSMNNGK